MFILAASSLKWALLTRSEADQESYKYNTLAISGLSFTPHARYQHKTVQYCLLHERKLNNVNDIVIWHDVINNSLSKHKNNNKNPLTIDQLVPILREYRHRIRAIVYCQRENTPYVFSELKTTGILIINILTVIVSPSKAKADKAEYFVVHQKPAFELKTFDTVRANSDNLEHLVNKTSRKRPSKRQRATKRKSLEQPSLPEQ